MRRAAERAVVARGDRVDVILGVEVCAGRFVEHVRAGFAAGFRGVARAGAATQRTHGTAFLAGRWVAAPRPRGCERRGSRFDASAVRRAVATAREAKHDIATGAVESLRARRGSRARFAGTRGRRQMRPPLAGCRFPEAMPDTDALPPRRPRPRGRPPPPRSGPMNVRDLARRVRIGGSDARADHTLARRRQ